MKKIYKSMCVMCALVLCSMSVMANHNDYTGQYLGYKSIKGEWKGAKIENGVWCYEGAGNHLRNFTITPLNGTEIAYSLEAINMGSLKSGEMAFAITWDDNQNYKVKMTKISVMGAILGSLSNTDSCRIGEGSAVSVKGEYHTVYYENQDGIENGVKLIFSRDAAVAMPCWIKEIHIDFEVYPLINIVEPQPIMVTMDESKPNYCNLTQCASIMQDGHMDLEAINTKLTYSCDNANVKITADNKAYAVAGGEYWIKVTQTGYTADASDPVKACHSETVDSFKLVVNTIDPVVETELTDSNSMEVDDVIYEVFTITDTLGMTFTVEPAGVITYDAEANTITAVGAGEATLTLYQPEVPGLRGEYNKEFVFVVSGVSTALAETAVADKAKKMMVNGQMIIIRNGQQFNTLGAELR